MLKQRLAVIAVRYSVCGWHDFRPSGPDVTSFRGLYYDGRKTTHQCLLSCWLAQALICDELHELRLIIFCNYIACFVLCVHKCMLLRICFDIDENFYLWSLCNGPFPFFPLSSCGSDMGNPYEKKSFLPFQALFFGIRGDVYRQSIRVVCCSDNNFY